MKHPEGSGFYYLSFAIAEWLRGISAERAVAYVEVDCFGGSCERSAALWQGGKLLYLAYEDAFQRAGVHVSLRENPVNQVLRLLGVSLSGALDEFEALGLGRHRETEDWISAAKESDG
jgi:hypothetical protein